MVKIFKVAYLPDLSKETVTLITNLMTADMISSDGKTAQYSFGVITAYPEQHIAENKEDKEMIEVLKMANIDYIEVDLLDV